MKKKLIPFLRELRIILLVLSARLEKVANWVKVIIDELEAQR